MVHEVAQVQKWVSGEMFCSQCKNSVLFRTLMGVLTAQNIIGCLYEDRMPAELPQQH